jgi:hypothetical protein
VTTLVLRHRVGDYEAWKRAFDADPLRRAASGVVAHRIYRIEGDIVVHLEFANRAEAEAFLPRLYSLWGGASERLGLGAVDVQLLEEVERG